MKRRIKLLGTLLIEEGEQPSPMMGRSKQCALLAYLIIKQQPQRRESVADLLWESTTTAQSLSRLRTLLKRMRKMMPDLIVSRQSLAFQMDDKTTIDLYQLEEGLNIQDRLSDDINAVRQVDEALTFYQGDLLSEFHLADAPRFNEWLLLEREKLRQRVTHAYDKVCLAYMEQEAWAKGVATAQRWLALDDLDEAALQYLLQFLAASGQIKVAWQQYEFSRQRLWQELGVEPEPETIRLGQQLQQLQATHGEGLSWDVVVGQQLAQLPPDQLAEPGPLPTNAYLPYHRNDDFTGRRTPLLQLARWLLPQPNQNKPPHRAVAVTGIGGVGKTQLAVEFCYRYGRFFPGGVYWLSFADEKSVAEEIAHIGSERGMGLYREADNLKQADRVGQVTKAWQEPIPRLLIFDNCESDTLLAKWAPVTGGCSILLTSRRAHWARELQVATWPLDDLKLSESVALLQRLAPRITTAEAETIAQTVGRLPLALHLVGSFLSRYQQISVSNYLKQLGQMDSLTHPSLQGRGVDYSPTNHALNVKRTFATSLAQFDPHDEVDQAAQHLLARAACFAPGEPIPQDILLATMGVDEADVMALLLAEDGLMRLVTLGLVAQQGSEMVLMHRLLVTFTQDVLTNVMAEAQTAVWQTTYQKLSDYVRQKGTTFVLPVALPHLYHLTHSAIEQRDEWAAELASLLGYHLHEVTLDYDAAQTYLQLAVDIAMETFGATSLEASSMLVNLGGVYLGAGAYREAREIYEQAIPILEENSKLLLTTSKALMAPLNNMGHLLTVMGDYTLGQHYLEQAILATEQQFGKEHAHMASPLGNLGALWLIVGEYDTAKAYLEQSLTLRQQTLGMEHPFTAFSLQNLGLLHLRQGDYEAAHNYLQQALQIRQHAVDANHPHMARSFNALGELSLAQGEYEAAHTFFERALTIQEAVLTAEHPDKGDTFKNLGQVYEMIGKPEQAQSYYEHAQAIWEKSVLESHVGLQKVRHRLADKDNSTLCD